MLPLRNGTRELDRFDSVTPPRFRKSLTIRFAVWSALALAHLSFVVMRPRSVWEPFGVTSGASVLCLSVLWVIGLLFIGAITWHEQWLAQRARQRGQLSDAIFQSTGFGMLLASHEHVLLDANPQACEMLGYEQAQLLGRRVDMLFGSHEDFIKFVEASQIQATLGTMALDWPILRCDGSLLWCTVSTRLVDLRNPDRGFIWGLTDTSGLRAIQSSLERVNGELVQARDEAISAARAKTEFLANMSHEIRTPLHGILGAVELLRRTALTDEQGELIAAVRRSGDSLLAILNDILDYSKLEAGQLQIEAVKFSPAREIRELALMFGTGIDAARVQLKVDLDERLPTFVLGDPTRFRQISSNLLSNAVKFTAVGQISVRLRLTALDDARCEVGLEVADTGSGISEEQQLRLFRPFSQADGSTARRHGGSGLGLMLTRRLAQAMGGSVTLSSKAGVGTTVHVELPFDVVPSIAEGTHNSPTLPPTLPNLAAAQQVTAKILIVEDVAVNQLIAKRFVEKCGADGVVVSNGKEAIEAYQNEVFDAILMDCQMPEIDGYEATMAIREIERSTERHVPIIAMTASAMAEDRQRCLDSGMDDYITKPLTIDALGQCLNGWLRRSPEKRDG